MVGGCFAGFLPVAADVRSTNEKIHMLGLSVRFLKTLIAIVRRFLGAPRVPVAAMRIEAHKTRVTALSFSPFEFLSRESATIKVTFGSCRYSVKIASLQCPVAVKL